MLRIVTSIVAEVVDIEENNTRQCYQSLLQVSYIVIDKTIKGSGQLSASLAAT